MHPLAPWMSKLRPREERGLVHSPTAAGRQRLGWDPGFPRLILRAVPGRCCTRGSEQEASVFWCLVSSLMKWGQGTDLEVTSPRWQNAFLQQEELLLASQQRGRVGYQVEGKRPEGRREPPGAVLLWVSGGEQGRVALGESS